MLMIVSIISSVAFFPAPGLFQFKISITFIGHACLSLLYSGVVLGLFFFHDSNIFLKSTGSCFVDCSSICVCLILHG